MEASKNAEGFHTDRLCFTEVENRAFLRSGKRLSSRAIGTLKRRNIPAHVTVVHVAMNEEEATQIGKIWDQWQQENLTQEEDTHLLIFESPYRALVPPLLAYIDTVHERHPDVTLSVVLPDYVIVHWWEYLLHNQTTFRLKAALRSRPGIVVIDVPQHWSTKSKAVVLWVFED